MKAIGAFLLFFAVSVIGALLLIAAVAGAEQFGWPLWLVIIEAIVLTVLYFTMVIALFEWSAGVD